MESQGNQRSEDDAGPTKLSTYTRPCVLFVFVVLTLLLTSWKLEGMMGASWYAVLAPLYVLGFVLCFVSLASCCSSCKRTNDGKATSSTLSSYDEEEEEEEEQVGRSRLEKKNEAKKFCCGEAPLCFRIELTLETKVAYFFTGLYLLLQFVLVAYAAQSESKHKKNRAMPWVVAMSPTYLGLLFSACCFLYKSVRAKDRTEEILDGKRQKTDKSASTLSDFKEGLKTGDEEEEGEGGEDEEEYQFMVNGGDPESPSINPDDVNEYLGTNTRMHFYWVMLVISFLSLILIILSTLNADASADSKWNWWLTFTPAWIGLTLLLFYLASLYSSYRNGILGFVMDSSHWISIAFGYLALFLTTVLLACKLQTPDAYSWYTTFCPLYLWFSYAVLAITFYLCCRIPEATQN